MERKKAVVWTFGHLKEVVLRAEDGEEVKLELHQEAMKSSREIVIRISVDLPIQVEYHTVVPVTPPTKRLGGVKKPPISPEPNVRPPGQRNVSRPATAAELKVGPPPKV